MSDIVIKEGNSILYSSKDNDDDDYIFDLNDMRFYDYYEESVRTILNELASKLDGPTVARLIRILSIAFLDQNKEHVFLTDEELQKIHG